ncbi:MAG: chemotaxis protein CheW [Xanthomonadales bacterium]|jgi:chemotaxis signal transduction protein|nr:chemotaxis protein CheW [Xanthomonadales bacterium]
MERGATPADTPEYRVLVHVRKGGRPLLLPAGLLPQIVSDPAISPLPGCQSWFPGVLARRGEMVPVFDIAAEWGDPPMSSTRRQVLVIESGDAPFAFLCAALPDVIPVAGLAVAAPADQPLPAPARYLSCWRRVATQLVPEFAILRWLSDATPRVLRR